MLVFNKACEIFIIVFFNWIYIFIVKLKKSTKKLKNELQLKKFDFNFLNLLNYFIFNKKYFFNTFILVLKNRREIFKIKLAIQNFFSSHEKKKKKKNYTGLNSRSGGFVSNCLATANKTIFSKFNKGAINSFLFFIESRLWRLKRSEPWRQRCFEFLRAVLNLNLILYIPLPI